LVLILRILIPIIMFYLVTFKKFNEFFNPRCFDMVKNEVGIMVLYILGILLGIISVVMAYFGLPENFDTEPLLGFGLLFVAIAGLKSIRK